MSVILDYALIDLDENWRYMVGLPAILAVVQFPIIFICPRSPHFLIHKGFDEEVRSILRRVSAAESRSSVREVEATLIVGASWVCGMAAPGTGDAGKTLPSGARGCRSRVSGNKNSSGETRPGHGEAHQRPWKTVLQPLRVFCKVACFSTQGAGAAGCCDTHGALARLCALCLYLPRLHDLTLFLRC